MKKLFSVLFIAASLFAACSDDNGEPTPPPATLDGLVYVEDGVYYLGNGNQEFLTPAGSYTLDASKTYIIRGWVYLQKDCTLTIPAGTILKGQSANDKVEGSSLIVEKGAKLYAEGTANNPIVFTSDKEPGKRKPGDWGGIIICGEAPNNQTDMQIEGGPRSHHGGTNTNDNSGVLAYCRIEFAGYPFDTDKEINGLTMGSVGKGTKIHHVQVSYSNDDSFEWFGGTVDCHHLVAYHGWDDDFDTDNGFNGTLQYLLGVRHPMIADTSASNGFESDNCSDGTPANPLTTAKFANVTLVGPIGQDPNFVNQYGVGNYITAGAMNPNNGSGVGQFQAGMQIRRGSSISVYNSVVMGWPVGIMIDNEKGSATQSLATANPERFKNIFFGGYTDNNIGKFNNEQTGSAPILGSDRNKSFADYYNTTGSAEGDDDSKISFSHDFITNTAIGTKLFSSVDGLMLKDPVSVSGVTQTGYSVNKNQNYGPVAGSPLIGNYTLPSGFDEAGSRYVGAFASDSDNWLEGWTEFDPQNAVY